MQDLVIEARQLPAAAIRRARSIAWIKPPSHLDHLVKRVRREHGGALAGVHAAIDERFSDRPLDNEKGAFYAAAELALIESVWRSELSHSDRSALRAPWEHLLTG